MYEVKTGDKFVVETIYSGMTEPDFPVHTVKCHKLSDITAHMFAPDMLTHRAPVLAADGKPLREGETVWSIEDGGPYKVTGIDPIVKEIRIKDESMELGVWVAACGLTHTKPEPSDSWERIEEDAGCTATKYNERRGTTFTTKQQVARDLVRRCRVLAERGE